MCLPIKTRSKDENHNDCDYGENIYADDGVFINFGAVILDGGKVTIGKKTLLAPGVHIYTARHPVNIEERRIWEDCKPVTIGEECWIGGRTTICPGVTIGDRAVIGAGAVVTRHISGWQSGKSHKTD